MPRGGIAVSTILSHPAVPLALSSLFPEGTLSRETVLLGMACSGVPDLDVKGAAHRHPAVFL